MNHIEIDGQIDARKKYSRLTDSEKLHTVKEVKLRKRDKKNIARDIGFSISTVRRVMDKMWSEGVSTLILFNLRTYT